MIMKENHIENDFSRQKFGTRRQMLRCEDSHSKLKKTNPNHLHSPVTLKMGQGFENKEAG